MARPNSKPPGKTPGKDASKGKSAAPGKEGQSARPAELPKGFKKGR